MIFSPYDARVTRVIDGDTLVLDVDLGFRIYTEIHVRLHGINAPEKDTPEGKAARDLVVDLVAHAKQVGLMTYGPDKYGGRWQGDVYLDGVSLATTLVAQGLAKAWDGKGARP